MEGVCQSIVRPMLLHINNKIFIDQTVHHLFEGLPRLVPVGCYCSIILTLAEFVPVIYFEVQTQEINGHEKELTMMPRIT